MADDNSQLAHNAINTTGQVLSGIGNALLGTSDAVRGSVEEKLYDKRIREELAGSQMQKSKGLLKEVSQNERAEAIGSAIEELNTEDWHVVYADKHNEKLIKKLAQKNDITVKDAGLIEIPGQTALQIKQEDMPKFREIIEPHLDKSGFKHIEQSGIGKRIRGLTIVEAEYLQRKCHENMVPVEIADRTDNSQTMSLIVNKENWPTVEKYLAGLTVLEHIDHGQTVLGDIERKRALNTLIYNIPSTLPKEIDHHVIIADRARPEHRLEINKEGFIEYMGEEAVSLMKIDPNRLDDAKKALWKRIDEMRAPQRFEESHYRELSKEEIDTVQQVASAEQGRIESVEAKLYADGNEMMKGVMMYTITNGNMTVTVPKDISVTLGGGDKGLAQNADLSQSGDMITIEDKHKIEETIVEVREYEQTTGDIDHNHIPDSRDKDHNGKYDDTEKEYQISENHEEDEEEREEEGLPFSDGDGY